MPKKIMVVRAGDSQLKVIKKAKDMGLFVVATDGKKDAPGFKLSDISYNIDAEDIDNNLKIAEENRIDGVLTIASEISIRTVAGVSQALCLAGIGYDVAVKCTDKELMRRAFSEKGLPAPRYCAIYSYKELLKQVKQFRYPLVVKPSDSAGSRGVKKVDGAGELEGAYWAALKHARNGKVLMEEFIEGEEVSVEAFVCDSGIKIIALSDKVRTAPPYLLDVKVLFPSARGKEEQERIIALAKNMIDAVGIKLGPVHIEIIVGKDGPVPVELAARGPGSNVFTDILPQITGIDLLKALIQVSLGETPDIITTKERASVLKFMDGRSGRLKKISGLNQARSVPGIYEIEFYVKEGDRVRSLTSGNDRLGHIISVADRRDEAEKAAETAYSLLDMEIEEAPDNG